MEVEQELKAYMPWEDQELHHGIPENKFPEVFFAGLWLPGLAAKEEGRFLRIDQTKLDKMVQTGTLTERAKGVRIDRLCLYYRLSCGLGPGGEHYPVLGTTHFWRDSESQYAVLYISPKNEWFDIMVLRGEAPNHLVPRNAGSAGASSASVS